MSERKFSVVVFDLCELLVRGGGHLVGGVGTGTLVLTVGELHGVGDHFDRLPVISFLVLPLPDLDRTG